MSGRKATAPCPDLLPWLLSYMSWVSSKMFLTPGQMASYTTMQYTSRWFIPSFLGEDLGFMAKLKVPLQSLPLFGEAQWPKAN